VARRSATAQTKDKPLQPSRFRGDEHVGGVRQAALSEIGSLAASVTLLAIAGEGDAAAPLAR
jgi:hypothetical protein